MAYADVRYEMLHGFCNTLINSDMYGLNVSSALYFVYFYLPRVEMIANFASETISIMRLDVTESGC